MRAGREANTDHAAVIAALIGGARASARHAARLISAIGHDTSSPRHPAVAVAADATRCVEDAVGDLELIVRRCWTGSAGYDPEVFTLVERTLARLELLENLAAEVVAPERLWTLRARFGRLQQRVAPFADTFVATPATRHRTATGHSGCVTVGSVTAEFEQRIPVTTPT